jgi:lipoprotein-anchoring transpeptidase ErfK/SrfK
MALWKRAALALVLVLFAAVAIAPSAGPSRSIQRGVKIAGVNMGGLDSEQARQQVIARFAAPLRFRMRDQRWSVPTSRLGLSVSAGDAVSEAFRADPGDDVDVHVEVDRTLIQSYVAALEERFGRPAKNATLLGLVHGRPAISNSSWGRAVRKRTMTDAITRTVKSRIRPRLPLVMKPMKPTRSRAKFGPVVIIRRGSNRLDLFAGTRLVRKFRVATGQAQYPTPTGLFHIVDMQQNPWWRPPDSDWAKGLKPIPPGPGNPLGTRWMGLSAPGVGIHGTPDPASIGYSASHGCIRMRIPDAEWLFQHVKVGTPVFIIDK